MQSPSRHPNRKSTPHECQHDEIRIKEECVTLTDYYGKEDAFFGSKQVRLTFTAHAEQVMLHAFSSSMQTYAYTKMTVALQDALKANVFLEEQFCFSGYHHSVMLLSALSSQLKRGPREHLFSMLQGNGGLKRVVSYQGNRLNDIVSDTLFRIDAVQKDFSVAHSFRLFGRLSTLFPVVLEYAPSWNTLRQEIDRVIRPPKGFVYEGCHLGREANSNASFDSESRFFDDDMRIRPLTVNDDVVTRWQERDVPPIGQKRDYFVTLNVGLKLRRGQRRLHLHVPIRIVSFAVKDHESRWIQPILVRMPREHRTLYSATMFTLTTYFLYAFKSSQLLLAGAAGALYVLETVELRDVDKHLQSKNSLSDLFLLRMHQDRLTTVQRDMLLNKLDSFTVEQVQLVTNGVRSVVDALMATHVLSQRPLQRVNFLSPETIEGL